MVAIVILNWNGWKDTIECLNSLYKIDFEDFFIIVGDNGSNNDSKVRIIEWCKENNRLIKQNSLKDPLPTVVEKGQVILYDMLENHGFAKGNNLMLKFISLLDVHYYFLLNNDTEVESDFMNQLLFYSKKYPQYCLLTPQIRLFFKQDYIWNCGGQIKFGIRRYNYVNRPVAEIKEKEIIDCNFVTGCAMLFNRSLLNENNELFTERFFFGEEDFELALRLKKEGKTMACVVPSIIYHKVGRSTRKADSLKRSYVYYLNRFINVRHYSSGISFSIWEVCYIPYVLLTLLREKTSLSNCLRFAKRLHRECRQLDGVSKSYFEEIWSPNYIV